MILKAERNKHADFYIYIYTLLVYLSVCLYPMKRLNQLSQNFVRDLTWPQGRFMDDQISKISPQQNSIFIQFWKSTKSFFYKLRATFYLLCYKVYKEKMFTIEIEDGLGAPWNRRWAWSTLKAQLLIKHFIQVLVLIISLRIKTSDIVFLI